MPEIAWIPFVTRHYHWLVQPVLALTEKYLGVPLTFFSDRPIPDVGPPHKVLQVFPYDCPLYRTPCCGYIRAALQQLDAPLVAIIMMDILPQNLLDHTKLQVLAEFMLTHPVARGNLWDDNKARGGFSTEQAIAGCAAADSSLLLQSTDNLEIIRVSPHHPTLAMIGSTLLMPALWNRHFLLEFMEDSWSFDAIEYPGQRKFQQQHQWYSVGTVPALQQIAHLMFTHDQNFIDLGTLHAADKPLVTPYMPTGFKVHE